MRRGTKQEAEPSSREEITKDAVLSPAHASVSKGNATYIWFSVTPVPHCNCFILNLKLFEEWFLVFTIYYEPSRKEI